MKDNHANAFRTATITFAAVALTILSYAPAFGADRTAPTQSRRSDEERSIHEARHQDGR